MFESDICCGMGGSHSLKNPEISSHILKRKLENINKTEASCGAMDCPACVLQIKGDFDKEGKRIKVKHTERLLAERLK
jgi:Fe-S oxidoreductase